jgi:hypothetical protein
MDQSGRWFLFSSVHLATLVNQSGQMNFTVLHLAYSEWKFDFLGGNKTKNQLQWRI